MTKIEIRPIRDAAGCTAVEQLQIDAWQMTNSIEVVPGHMLLTFHKNGGVLLGAYLGFGAASWLASGAGTLIEGFKFSALGVGGPHECPQWVKRRY